MEILRVEHLSKIYNTGENAIKAVDENIKPYSAAFSSPLFIIFRIRNTINTTMPKWMTFIPTGNIIDSIT